MLSFFSYCSALLQRDLEVCTNQCTIYMYSIYVECSFSVCNNSEALILIVLFIRYKVLTSRQFE
jgi:hypothetical protein